ncbi:MAG: cytidylate kinase [Candidatus Woesearchaeota archaeon]|jgi:cytidylate kinase
MKITICGFPGSGKGTASKAISQKLNLQHYCAGDLRREAAKQRSMTLSEFNEWAESNPQEGDKLFDQQTKEIGVDEDNFIFDGRLAFYFIPDSIKIYLSCDVNEAAKRKFASERIEERASSVDSLVHLMRKRVDSDKGRYESLYNVQVYNMKDFDLVIDTTTMTPQEVLDQIVSFVTHKA